MTRILSDHVETTQMLEHLQAFIAEEILEGEDVGLTATTELLTLGILNSLEIQRLLAFVEEKIGVVVEDQHIRPEHFATLNDIAKLIAELEAAKS